MPVTGSATPRAGAAAVSAPVPPRRPEDADEEPGAIIAAFLRETRPDSRTSCFSLPRGVSRHLPGLRTWHSRAFPALLNRGRRNGREPGAIMGRWYAKRNDHGPPVREDARAEVRRDGCGYRARVALLVVFAGLPGSGKSVLARGVADAIGATYLRIDSIESAIVATLTPFRDNPVGYVVAERVAADQLVSGRDVVADAVNGVGPAREGWAALAARTGATLRFVEVRCSDAAEHRRRVESRGPEMPGQGVPTWEQVTRRRYEPWPPGLPAPLTVDNVGDPATHIAHIVTGLPSPSWHGRRPGEPPIRSEQRHPTG
jgi:predicted kinase